jgi:hypothetical protein
VDIGQIGTFSEGTAVTPTTDWRAQVEITTNTNTDGPAVGIWLDDQILNTNAGLPTSLPLALVDPTLPGQLIAEVTGYFDTNGNGAYDAGIDCARPPLTITINVDELPVVTPVYATTPASNCGSICSGETMDVTFGVVPAGAYTLILDEIRHERLSTGSGGICAAGGAVSGIPADISGISAYGTDLAAGISDQLVSSANEAVRITYFMTPTFTATGCTGPQVRVSVVVNPEVQIGITINTDTTDNVPGNGIGRNDIDVDICDGDNVDIGQIGTFSEGTAVTPTTDWRAQVEITTNTNTDGPAIGIWLDDQILTTNAGLPTSLPLALVDPTLTGQLIAEVTGYFDTNGNGAYDAGIDCARPPLTITINVDPLPVVSRVFGTSPAANCDSICSGDTMDVTFTVVPTGTYTLNLDEIRHERMSTGAGDICAGGGAVSGIPADVSGISAIGTDMAAGISDVLSSTADEAVRITYFMTPTFTATGCTGPQVRVSVIVLPVPATIVTYNASPVGACQPICSDNAMDIDVSTDLNAALFTEGTDYEHIVRRVRFETLSGGDGDICPPTGAANGYGPLTGGAYGAATPAAPMVIPTGAGLSETLVNPTNEAVRVTYRIATRLKGTDMCMGPDAFATAIIIPEAQIGITINGDSADNVPLNGFRRLAIDQDLCDGDTVNIGRIGSFVLGNPVMPDTNWRVEVDVITNNNTYGPPVGIWFEDQLTNVNGLLPAQIPLNLVDPLLPGGVVVNVTRYYDANGNGMFDPTDCARPPLVIMLDVAPLPVVTRVFGTSPAANCDSICSGDAMDVTFTVAPAGTYTLNLDEIRHERMSTGAGDICAGGGAVSGIPADVAGISAIGTDMATGISDVLTSTANEAVRITYFMTPTFTATGCAGPQVRVSVIVLPEPATIVTYNASPMGACQPICSDNAMDIGVSTDLNSTFFMEGTDYEHIVKRVRFETLSGGDGDICPPTGAANGYGPLTGGAYGAATPAAPMVIPTGAGLSETLVNPTNEAVRVSYRIATRLKGTDMCMGPDAFATAIIIPEAQIGITINGDSADNVPLNGINRQAIDFELCDGEDVNIGPIGSFVLGNPVMPDTNWRVEVDITTNNNTDGPAVGIWIDDQLINVNAGLPTTIPLGLVVNNTAGEIIANVTGYYDANGNGMFDASDCARPPLVVRIVVLPKPDIMVEVI